VGGVPGHSANHNDPTGNSRLPPSSETGASASRIPLSRQIGRRGPRGAEVATGMLTPADAASGSCEAGTSGVSSSERAAGCSQLPSCRATRASRAIRAIMYITSREVVLTRTGLERDSHLEEPPADTAARQAEGSRPLADWVRPLKSGSVVGPPVRAPRLRPPPTTAAPALRE
jgi:hypothetical protein